MRGTATPIVSGGKVLGTWDKPDNTLLRFLLQHRLPQRYGFKEIKPGHPLFESIRQQVLAERRAREPDIEDVRQEILRKVEAMERLDAIQARQERMQEMDEEREQYPPGVWCGPAGAE